MPFQQGFATRHIFVDTINLHRILKLHSLPPHDVPGRDLSSEMRYWKPNFWMNKFCSDSGDGNVLCAYSFRTDGHSVSVHVRKFVSVKRRRGVNVAQPRPPAVDMQELNLQRGREAIKRCLEQYEGASEDSRPKKRVRIVGLDPGRTSMYTAANLDLPCNPQIGGSSSASSSGLQSGGCTPISSFGINSNVVHFSAAEYRELSGVHEAGLRTAQWNLETASLERAIPGMNTGANAAEVEGAAIRRSLPCEYIPGRGQVLFWFKKPNTGLDDCWMWPPRPPAPPPLMF